MKTQSLCFIYHHWEVEAEAVYDHSDDGELILTGVTSVVRTSTGLPQELTHRLLTRVKKELLSKLEDNGVRQAEKEWYSRK